jgi:hypothetical protein
VSIASCLWSAVPQYKNVGTSDKYFNTREDCYDIIFRKKRPFYRQGTESTRYRVTKYDRQRFEELEAIASDKGLILNEELRAETKGKVYDEESVNNFPLQLELAR